MNLFNQADVLSIDERTQASSFGALLRDLGNSQLLR
jgi:hypothetical protein